ncbi:DUF3047 domain-containing protein [Fodinibius sediminis]|uniref:DUF3047 domain-containing protein n=1 Tax=Fodinibius sediminis TaxID=1214077 RepID=A0A521B6R9_9BACT|nr:DUF3047 domain-containing protein [Fodinibius sediminis]SMO42794.1 Protein of unknown function [Fodinibius sediminis]
MKRLDTRVLHYLLLIALISAGNTESAGAQQPVHMDSGTVLLENFEHDTTGKLPHKWYDRDGNKKLINHDESFSKNYLYKVDEEGDNKFLRYKGSRAKHINLPLINKDKDNIYNINIFETPILSWKVRAHKLPHNAREDDDDYNDSVASVYVVFDMGRVAFFKKVPKTIRYTWSSTLEEGSTASKLFGNQQIKVVKSGNEDTGKWITFERNLVQDYRRLFGDDPPRTPMAILVMSDGNSTGSWVKADYDDIMLKPQKEQKAIEVK